MPLLPGDDAAAIAQAADALAAGDLVAFPTETVYGLGARADDDTAVARIITPQGRPSDHPLIVHVADAAQADEFAAALPPVARRLIDAFWPGPLTVIVPRRADRGAAAAGGQDTIGLRCPAHPVAQALLRAAAARGVRGVAAPSANRFGRVSPTSAQHVVDEFGAALRVLDGGACPVGIESSIVDCSRGGAVLLRPGVLNRAAIEAAAGERLGAPDAQSPRASGTLASHYAPRARVCLFDAQALSAMLSPGKAAERPEGLAVYSRTVSVGGAVGVRWHRAMPVDAARAAQELFSVLRALDAQGAQQIWVEQPPDTPDWDGVRDRLRRAAAA
jgi:L-threonylcarbamoyladenylate synthase